jgi:DNA-binding PadR family transcriptional regulator
MSYIEILILRHLSQRPAHGYELRKRVEAVTGIVLNNNTMYPALRRFEEAGAVTKTAHPQQGRPPKLVYQLTDVGHALLHDMIADLPPEQAVDDYEFMARLGQFAFLSPAERLAVLDARDAALAERDDRLRDLSDRAGAERWSTLVTAELIARGEQERAWIASLRGLAGEPEPPEAGPRASTRAIERGTGQAAQQGGEGGAEGDAGPGPAHQVPQ